MLENFQLAVVVKDAGQMRLLRIPLHQELQNNLANGWNAQFETFTRNINEINFDPGYTPEDDERFRINGYDLPDWLNGMSSRTIQNLDPINDHDDIIDSAGCIVAFARVDRSTEVILFQNFSRSHVIKPGRFLFLQNGTYVSAQRPGLTLDSKLTAFYLPHQRKLLFQNFRATNSFLPLEDFYEEASEDEIREVLNHDHFAPEDVEALAVDANQWFKKRFAMLKGSQILDNFTVQQIRARSQGYPVNIRVSNHKIVFPADKAEAKKLLQFLNEELFKGAITETLFETNSKRVSD